MFSFIQLKSQFFISRE